MRLRDVSSESFVVAPPHLALCSIIRLLISSRSEPRLNVNANFTARLVRFCLKQRRDTTSLNLPSLNKIITALHETFGIQGTEIGTSCRERLSRAKNVVGLKRFFDNMKRDMQGNNGVSSLLQVVEPKSPIKLPQYSPLALFMRECIASFEEMRFEEMCRLASDMAVYCPSMLEQEHTSQYFADKLLLERHFQLMSREISSARLSSECDLRLQKMVTELPQEPRVLLFQSERSILLRDFSDAMENLNRYCTRRSRTRTTELKEAENAFKHIHTMCLKMAQVHDTFNHIEESRLALEEAFSLAKKIADEEGIISCLVLAVQVMLNGPLSRFQIDNSDDIDTAQRDDTEETIDIVHRLLMRCCEKAKQLKLPHILAFAIVNKSLLALKYNIIDGKKANLDEVHRYVLMNENHLRRLRKHVVAGMMTLDIRHHPRPGQGPIETSRLFHTAASVFSSTIQDRQFVMRTVDKLTVTMLGYCAWSWSRVGHRGLNLVSLLSAEVVFGTVTDAVDRADSVANLAILHAEQKGAPAGRRILKHIQKLDEMQEQMPLMSAEKYLTASETLSQNNSSGSLPSSSKIMASMRNLAAWQAGRTTSSALTDLAAETLFVRALVTMNQHDTVQKPIETLITLCQEQKLTTPETEILITRCMQDAQLYNEDLASVYLSEAATFLDGTNWTEHSAKAVLLFGLSLKHLKPEATGFLEHLLAIILPYVTTEGSAQFQTEVLKLCLACKQGHGEKDANATFAITKRGTFSAAAAGRWTEVLEFATILRRLLSDSKRRDERLALYAKLEQACLDSEIESAGVGFRQSIWPEPIEDLMEVD